jgi:hypothetical protein
VNRRATIIRHAIANLMLDAGRDLGQGGYPGFNAYGDKGVLSPGLWSAAFLDYWTRAKAPAALPSFGLSVEVERITRGATPIATISIRRD